MKNGTSGILWGNGCRGYCRFNLGGCGDCLFNGSFDALSEFLKGKTPAILVNDISVGWLGTFGGILAMLGVIAAPITSGDTALRSARLIAADFCIFLKRKSEIDYWFLFRFLFLHGS